MQASLRILYVGASELLASDDRLPATERSGHADDADAGGAVKLVQADTPSTALDRLEAEPLDCVVVEHRPPRVDAFEFVESLRTRNESVPLLVVTRDGSAERARAALDAGANDVIQTAPGALTRVELTKRVRRLLGGSDDGPGAPSDDRAPASASDGWTVSGDAGGRASAEDRRDQGARESVVEQSGTTDAASADVPVRRRGGADPPSPAELREVTARIGGAETSDAVADAVLDVAPELLDVPGVGVFLLDDDGNRLRPAAITDRLVEYYGDELVFGAGRPDSITWTAFVRGEPRFVDDVSSAGTRVNEDTDARGAAFVPLGDHGVLVAATEEPAAFSNHRRDVVRLLGDVTETALERIALDRIAQDRERRLRTVRQDSQRGQRIAELVRSLVQTLVDAESRADVEREVCDLLVRDDRIAFAWIGTPDHETGTIEPSHWAGTGSRYLDGLSLSVDDSDEPTCSAARTGDVTVASNVTRTMNSGDWERAALASTFHAAAGVPLTYDGVRYGVLGVYADRPGAFDELDANLLRDVGAAVAFAINAAETRAAVVATDVTELELRIEAPGDALNGLSQATGATVDCLDLAPQPDGTTDVLFSAAGADPAAVLDATADLVAIRDVHRVGGTDEPRFRASVAGETVPSVFASIGASPTALTADGGVVTVTVEVPTAIEPRTVVSRLEQSYPATELLARRDGGSARTRVGFRSELETALTDRQLEVLQTAHELGFFESPREANGNEVAEALDVSQPTISHHLREGQGRLFSLLFDDD